MRQERMTTKQLKSTRTEKQDHLAIAQLLGQIKYEGRPLQWTHVPNEGKRNPASGRNLKLMGMKKGLPDFIIFDSPPKFPDKKGAVIELKKEAGGEMSDAQREWLNYFKDNNWVMALSNGIDAAIYSLKLFGYIS
jgi:hypothetical protein